MPTPLTTRRLPLAEPIQPVVASPGRPARYSVLVRNAAFTPLAFIHPKEDEIGIESIRWTRNWRAAGQVELRVRKDNAQLLNLIQLGNYIEVCREEEFEALYMIQVSNLATGILRYSQDASAHINAAHVAGAGTGTARDLVRRLDAAAITDFVRMEKLRDARDVTAADFTQLEQRADAVLAEAAILRTLVTSAAGPTPEDEIVTVRGSSLLLHASGRIVIPPPATIIGGTNRVDITGATYDSDTDSADEVMKHYVTTHLVSPADGSRAVANFVNQGAIPALATITFNGRFQTVLEALQEIAAIVNAGFEVVLNASDEFEFQVVPQRDRTVDSSQPVVFRESDVLLDRSGRAYRENWDVGDLVTILVESIDLEIDLTIREVSLTMRQGQATTVKIAFDSPGTDEIDKFASNLERLAKANAAVVRV